MPNARQTDSVVATASSRLYRRHQRYARSLRLNHSKQLLRWLSVQATRMSTTSALVLAALDTYTADQIETMANL